MALPQKMNPNVTLLKRWRGWGIGLLHFSRVDTNAALEKSEVTLRGDGDLPFIVVNHRVLFTREGNSFGEEEGVPFEHVDRQRDFSDSFFVLNAKAKEGFKRTLIANAFVRHITYQVMTTCVVRIKPYVE